MASRYWVGGSGNWNDTAHWSTASGGAGGSSVPVSTDDVFIDQNSGSPTVATNSQTVIVNNLHIGSSTSTFYGVAAAIKLSITGTTTSIGILGNTVNIYGDGQIIWPDYNRYLDIVTNVTFTNYSVTKLPPISVSNAATLSIAGRINYIPKLTVSATGGASTVNFTNTSLITVVGYISTGAGCKVNFGWNGTLYWTDQILDDTLTGAPANGGFDGVGTTAQAIDGVYNLVIGSYVDVYAGGQTPINSTRRSNKARMDFNFANMLDGGITAKTITVDYVVARISGRTRTPSFTLGQQPNSSPRVFFNGDAYLGDVNLVSGEMILEGITLYMESITRTTSATDTVYIHGGSVSSPFTGRGIIELYTTATLVNVRIKDITISHKQIVRMDGYDVSNFDTSISNSGSSGDRVGQTFTAATTAKLHNAIFYLDYSGSAPTGNMESYLYTTSGTVGSTAVPTTFLAKSMRRYANDLPSGTKTPFSFIFWGQDAVTITSGTDRAVMWARVSGGVNAVRVAVDGSSPTHAGNYIARSSGVFSAVASRDTCFELYGSIDDTTTGLYLYDSIDAGGNIGMAFKGHRQRQYTYTVYSATDTNQTVPLGVIPEDEIISDFAYSCDINSIAGPVTIRRAVDPETIVYNGDSLINYNNTVMINMYGPFGGKTVYRGFISGWKPHLTGNDKYVDITVLPFSSELSNFAVVTGPSLDVSYTNTGSALSFTSTKIAISWTTSGSATTITGLDLGGIGIPVATSGTTTTPYTIKIYKDNGTNTPDNTSALYTVTGSASPDASGYSYLGPGNYPIVGLSSSISSKYWVVVELTSPLAGQTFSNARTTTSNGYASGNFAYWNGSSWVNSSSNGVLQFRSWRGSANTTVSFSTSLFSAANTINTNYTYQGGRCTIYYFELGETANSLIYTFQNQTVLDALNIIVSQAGDDWYWYDDPGNSRVVITRKSTGQAWNQFGLGLFQYIQDKAHFTVGKDVSELNLEFTIEQMVNDLIVIGGDTGGGSNLFREYISSTSIQRYGRRQKIVSDPNLTNSTVADVFGQAYIRAFGLGPIIRSPLTLLANYPFEWLHPGMAFDLSNTTMGGIEYQISRLDFSGDECQVTAGTVPTQVTDYTSQNTAQIDQLVAEGNPSAPTVVVVA